MRTALVTVFLPLFLLAGFGTAAQAADPPLGGWLVEDIGGAGVIDNAQTTLELGDGGAVSGSGGCNRYSGSATLQGNTITFGQVASTMMACVPALMDQEQRYFAALEAVVTWTFADSKLRLLDGQGTAVITLSPLEPEAALTITVPYVEEVQTVTATYDCGTMPIVAEYYNAGSVSLVALSMKGEFVVAANVMSGSGARYAGGRYIWWTKGPHADLYDVTQGDNAAPIASCDEVKIE